MTVYLAQSILIRLIAATGFSFDYPVSLIAAIVISLLICVAFGNKYVYKLYSFCLSKIIGFLTRKS